MDPGWGPEFSTWGPASAPPPLALFLCVHCRDFWPAWVCICVLWLSWGMRSVGWYWVVEISRVRSLVAGIRALQALLFDAAYAYAKRLLCFYLAVIHIHIIIIAAGDIQVSTIVTNQSHVLVTLLPDKLKSICTTISDLGNIANSLFLRLTT